MGGKIIKGIGGFYYVAAGGRVYECKAKGIFRKDHRKPLVGDDVLIEVLDEEKELGNITELLPRHSELIRPAVANVDQALIIFSITKPKPNLNLLDRFLIMMETQKLPCIICFSKLDLDEDNQAEKLCEIYENCGYETLSISVKEGEGISKIRDLLKGKTTTVAGPSGVGKSSLVNCLQGNVVMETGEVSKKIDRGKHTTRHTQLLEIAESTYILDTPGFSSLGLFDVTKDDLGLYFREFGQYEKHCKFAGCSHVTEPICGIKAACESGEISRVRYDSYCLLYKELQQEKKHSY